VFDGNFGRVVEKVSKEIYGSYSPSAGRRFLSFIVHSSHGKQAPASSSLPLHLRCFADGNDSHSAGTNRHDLAALPGRIYFLHLQLVFVEAYISVSKPQEYRDQLIT
jgi:hypothetical protein